MTRHKALKRSRLIPILSGASPVSADAVLPMELWYIALTYCLPAALLAARGVCRIFRSIIDARLLFYCMHIVRRTYREGGTRRSTCTVVELRD
ncbi:uncharacterized protein SCHCODRAFT_02627634 [Schizophyllum commune H4-8]|uniref:uncharacterized protein n=1 Tax=Schizophyllum commune (strain H4-8 / FGSC 9210) TaxID=578458 RepID=UPI00215F975E|nr:uncharacterized protein SCHCODRAFT_02627634 [Schizophyllum commune H4-8]KAI5890918.1 hypothetical protein SCHCODRAFT_02627634 [Schizophyllum commune H4-8]